MLEERPDMTTAAWHDEGGRQVQAIFVGWRAPRSPEHPPGMTQGPVVAMACRALVGALFGSTPGIEVHNVVRSIEPCSICGGVVYVAADGTMLVARTDAEQAAARDLVSMKGDAWGVLGHAEFWVRKAAEEYFVSPTLMLHSLAEHGYVPPPDLVDALMAHAE